MRGDHFPDARLADGLELLDLRQQLRLTGVQKIAQQMHFVAVQFGGQFGAGDELDAQGLAGRRPCGAQPSTVS